jgi:hypothetical protein
MHKDSKRKSKPSQAAVIFASGKHDQEGCFVKKNVTDHVFFIMTNEHKQDQTRLLRGAVTVVEEQSQEHLLEHDDDFLWSRSRAFW